MPKVKAKTVDEYIARFPGEAGLLMQELRALIQSTIPQVDEQISWNIPFYRCEGHVCGFGGHTHHFTFSCWDIMVLDEHRDALEKQGYNTTKNTLQIGYDQSLPVEQIQNMLQRQLDINAQKKAGLMEPSKCLTPDMPAEFQEALDTDPVFKDAFDSLTPGRQRGYIFHFAGAKQSKTRIARIEKCRPKILAGKGLQER